MPRDSQPKLSSKKVYNKKCEKKRVIQSDSESSDDSSDYDDEEEVEQMDDQEYRKFLGKMFPSKYLDKKIKAGKDLKQALKKEDKNVTKKSKKEESESEEEDEESEEEEEVIVKKKSNKKAKKEESDSEEEEENTKSKSNKYNIIFTIGQNGEEYDDDYEDEEEESDWEDIETEDEDVSVSTDEDDDDEEEAEEKEIVTKKKEKMQESKEKMQESKEKMQESKENDEEILIQLKELQEKSKNSSLITDCIRVCQEKIKEKNAKKEKKQLKQKDKNARIFKRIIRDKNTMNDFTFFEKLDLDNQIKIIKQVREINKISRVEKPYRITLLESDMPAIFKAAAIKKINSLRYMEPGSGEYYKIKNWVDTFMRIPFNKFETLPVNISDGMEACNDFMENAKQTLDASVYGLNDAKMQIMQMLGQLVTNPVAIGSAIAIKGPMGTGKTTLVKEGISKILNRPFAFIALGGATDSSFLEGHSYTYEGSVWGKIVQIIIDSQCMNPVIYFDELDKISDTPKGEEIAGILTHLTDTTQNSQFHDKYFAEVDFDLSKCLFIFSYYDESKINPILRDRMYRIQTKGYDKKQKTVISNNYLLPKIREQVKFTSEDIIIPDESIHHIIEMHCDKEDGVRNLKRCLEIIYTKLNLYRLMKPDSSLFEGEMSLKVEFPFTVTKEIVDKLIKREKDINMSAHAMYV